MSASQRLTHLLELADKGPTLRAALAEEVAEMLTHWPADYPAEIRATCEGLLAEAARDMDKDARAHLRVCLYADPELAARILPREMPERMLVQAARAGDAAAPLARALGVTAETAKQILADKSGQALAIAAKSLGLSRAAYSALAFLATDNELSLEAFDQVNAVEAAQQLRRWSAQRNAQTTAA